MHPPSHELSLIEAALAQAIHFWSQGADNYAADYCNFAAQHLVLLIEELRAEPMASTQSAVLLEEGQESGSVSDLDQ